MALKTKVEELSDELESGTLLTNYQLFMQAEFIKICSSFEFILKYYCSVSNTYFSTSLSPNQIRGNNSIDSQLLFLEKVIQVEGDVSKSSKTKLFEYQKLRNVFIHSEGIFNKSDKNKIDFIVSKTSFLKAIENYWGDNHLIFKANGQIDEVFDFYNLVHSEIRDSLMTKAVYGPK